MTAIQDILRSGVAIQAGALAVSNLDLLKKKKESQTKRLLKAGVRNIVGIPILQTQSQLIGTIGT